MALDHEMQLVNLPHIKLVNAKAHPSTYEAVFQLTKQRFSPTMATIHMKRLQHPQLEMYAALLNEQPVGRIGLLNIGDVGRVKSVFVGGEYRGLGIASAMLSHIVKRCREHNHRTICLEVEQENIQAVRCYQRFGFRTIGVIPSFARR